MKNTTKTIWLTKTKKIVLTVFAGLGITGAGVWGTACTVAKSVELEYVRPYVTKQCVENFNRLHHYNDSINITMQHDIRLLCLMVELNTSDSLKQLAIKRMNDTNSYWKVR